MNIAVVQTLKPRLVADIVAARPARLLVLEPSAGSDDAVRRIEAAGIAVEHPDFFAGDLQTAGGESVYLTARDLAYRVASPLVRRLIDESPVLREVEALGRPGTLAIRLEKSLMFPLFGMALAVEVARVVARPHAPVVWVDLPWMAPAGSGAALAPDLDVRPVPEAPAIGWSQLGRSLLGSMLMRSLHAMAALAPSKVDALAAAPTILTVHEEDLLDDRSYRGMLHWLDLGSARPACRTVVMPQRLVDRSSTTAEYLSKARIVLLSPRDVARCVRRARSKLQRTLRSRLSRCLWRALTAPTGTERAACVEAWKLLGWARDIAAVAEATGARAWVGCEGWQTPMDAVNVVADSCAVKTCVFQYGSIRLPTPTMVTTADVAAIIGDVYAPLFRWNDIGARAFKATGYPYAYAFPLVRERARALREKLERRGARFVLGFFDESVQYSRWGLISVRNHLHELTALARATLADPTLAVIIKPKYAWNDPQRLYPDEKLLQEAAATGRYVVMTKGEHRSANLPAEIALSCDACIGHLFATSASLEAALAGVRSVVIRQYRERTLLDDILARIDVIYPSMDAVLEALAAFRAGEPARSALGDWSTVLPRLDPYRDGRAGQRLRELLEGWALAPHTQDAGRALGRVPSARTVAP